MVEAFTDISGERGIADYLRSIEQEVVVIEHVLALLRLDIGGK